jgi:hypothetical protein
VSSAVVFVIGIYIYSVASNDMFLGIKLELSDYPAEIHEIVRKNTS